MPPLPLIPPAAGPARRVGLLLSAVLPLAVALATPPAAAESIAASVASSTASLGSASVRSLSESVQGSSRSSSPDGRHAVGDWRLIHIAELPERPGLVALRLQRLATDPASPAATGPTPADAPAGPAERMAAQGDARASASPAAEELVLHLPAEALAARPLAVGDLVVARARGYGLWFAQRATDGQDRPFFLALRDDWQGELGSRAL